MSLTTTLAALRDFCSLSSGQTNKWQGVSGVYRWTPGKTTATGTLNGVVRKIVGIDQSNKEIWVVAGSFKIDQAGKILRFTGLSRKNQTLIEGIGEVKSVATSKEAVEG